VADGRVYVVTSGKGGTGKTTTVAALSSCLAVMGCRTLCIDCDVGLSNLDISLGMTEFAVSGVSDVLTGGMALLDCVHEHPSISGLFFLSAPDENAAADPLLQKQLFAEIRREFDFCLIDSPAGIGDGFRASAQNADAALLVVTPDLSVVRDAAIVAGILFDMGITDQQLIINRVVPRLLRKTESTLDDVIDDTGVRLCGYVFEDKDVYLSAYNEIPLVLYSEKRAARCYLKIAKYLVRQKEDRRI
jgi:septum site-determining protein MinD